MPGYPQKKIPVLHVTEAQDEGGLGPGKSNDLQRGCRKSPPAEVDHDLEIPVEGEPPNGSHAYVANYYVNTVSVIDTASNTVTATIPVGSGPAVWR